MNAIASTELTLILFIVLILLILPLICVIDIVKNQFGGNDKLVWVIVVIFLPIIGALLYLLIGRKQKIR